MRGKEHMGNTQAAATSRSEELRGAASVQPEPGKPTQITRATQYLTMFRTRKINECSGNLEGELIKTITPVNASIKMGDQK